MNDTRQKVRDTFSAFLGPVINAGVPFAATYGNHDFQCGSCLTSRTTSTASSPAA